MNFINKCEELEENTEVLREKRYENKKGFVLRDVAGRSVVVATGAAAKRFRGMVMLNETGKEIWTRLQKGMDQDEIIRSMIEDYDVSEEKATADVQNLIGQMWENGFLEK